MNKRWILPEADPGRVSRLQQQLRIHPALCSILVQRGIHSFEQARDFFRPQLSQLHSPWLLKDMQKAVQRIQKAMAANEKILVYGDYDVDGTTSVACMFRFLTSIYNPAQIGFYIPHRYREGYGISQQGIDYAAENGYTLVIALDCGIKSVELITYANTRGVDFIVCDHHLPDAQLPPAAAILNPKQADCTYPYKELCGCGVGFKLICALAETLQLPESVPHTYLDLVATAIAADIVPITGENRILAYYGLKKVNEDPSFGIAALKQLSGLTRPLRIDNLVFMIAPRVNAAGRMDDATKAVQMFIANSYNEALEFAQQLHTDNDDRKEADSSITQEALSIIRNNPQLHHRNTTVLYQPHWHKGVVGIVASRLTEHYYRPTVILTESGAYAAGSARSVAGFNLYEAIHACRQHLLGYGGHFAAAGLTLEKEKIPDFSAAFEEIVSATITPEQLVPALPIDAVIDFNAITPGFFNILQQMEPFGPDNMRPVFLTRGVTDTGYSRIVKEAHLRLVVKQANTTFTGIFFKGADRYDYLKQGPVDLVYTIEENEYNGSVSLQLKVLDLLPATPQ
ncbi:MAG: single-stranded-DNA-specific exonuclease RecJ [Lacibacter sp.]